MEQGKNQEKKKYPEFPVLVVDDERNFLNSIDSLLAIQGITNIECCQDSEEVMTRLKNRKYSLILLDLIVPGINGIELLPKIDYECPDIPVIILTGHPEEMTPFECKKLGASGYWKKTDATKELIATIQNALHVKKHDKPVKVKKDKEKDDVEFKTTIHFHTKPPEVFFVMNLWYQVNYFSHPVGSKTLKSSRARIIAATSKNLSALIQTGAFRYDLYNHLKAHEIHTPPLRERKEDIPLLVDYFLGKAAKETGIEKPAISGELLPLLEKYNFPGNVGELKKMVNHAVSRRQSGILTPDDFFKGTKEGGE